MTSKHTTEGVKETTFLDDVTSIQAESFCQSPNFSRPFVIPVYDPQCSNEDPLKVHSTPKRPARTVGNLPVWDGHAGSEVNPPKSFPSPIVAGGVSLYHGDQSRARSKLGVDAHRRRSRVSMTPSELPYFSGALSKLQEQELKHMTRHENRGDRNLRTTPTLLELPHLGEDGPSSPVTKKPTQTREEPPDGGLLAWAQVFAGFLVILNCQGMNLSFGLFQAYYETILLPNTSPSRLAWIGSFQCFGIFSMGLIVHPAMQRDIHFRYFTLGGSFLILIGLIATSFCTQFWQLFMAQGIVTGVGMGAVFSAGVAMLLDYFSSRLGIASATVAAGAPVGGILFPVIGRALSTRVSFGWTVRVFAIINLVTMIIANLILRRRQQRPSRLVASSPMSDCKDQNRALPTLELSEQQDDLSARPFVSMLKPYDVPYMLMLIGMFFGFWGLYNGFYFIVTFGQGVLHLGESTSINLLIAMNASNLVGSIPPGLISDACLGPLNTMIPATFLCGAFALLMTGVNTESGVFLVACFYGFAAATLQSLYIGTIYSFVGGDRTKAGAKMGMVMAAVGLATLTGAPIGGQLVARHNGSYINAQVFAGISLVIGGCFFVGARFAKSGWVSNKL